MNIQVPRKKPRLEITNAVDIMFFMLVFFMLFSTMRTEQTGLDVKLPQATTGKATKVEDLVVSIDETKQVYWGNQPITLDELTARIQGQLQTNPNSRFIIQADRTVQYDDLVKVLDQARVAGGTKVALAVKPAKEPER
jgi:biopolymer transport protein ExbD